MQSITLQTTHSRLLSVGQEPHRIHVPTPFRGDLCNTAYRHQATLPLGQPTINARLSLEHLAAHRCSSNTYHSTQLQPCSSVLTDSPFIRSTTESLLTLAVSEIFIRITLPVVVVVVVVDSKDLGLYYSGQALLLFRSSHSVTATGPIPFTTR